MGIYNDFIRDLRKENGKLKRENDTLDEACKIWKKVYEDVDKENDDLKRKANE